MLGLSRPSARKVDFESLDVFGVEDVMDVGGGERRPQPKAKAVFERRFSSGGWKLRVLGLSRIFKLGLLERSASTERLGFRVHVFNM